jgi:hypothetical protein
MSTCWKCGANTPDGVIECGDCAQTIFTQSGVAVKPVPINFAKVETWEDFKEIMSHWGMYVAKDSDLHKLLRRFTDE